ncbi:MAG: deoxyribonuclease HsdR, partial [Flammeovirgaceae bacterium]
MKNLKNYLVALFFSFIGGLTSVTGYKYFTDDNNTVNLQSKNNLRFANYVFDTTDVIVPEGMNFVYTSKKTTPAVVHIRTTYDGRSSGVRSPFEDMFRDFFGERYSPREREMPQRRGSG